MILCHFLPRVRLGVDLQKEHSLGARRCRQSFLRGTRGGTLVLVSNPATHLLPEPHTAAQGYMQRKTHARARGKKKKSDSSSAISSHLLSSGSPGCAFAWYSVFMQTSDVQILPLALWYKQGHMLPFLRQPCNLHCSRGRSPEVHCLRRKKHKARATKARLSVVPQAPWL